MKAINCRIDGSPEAGNEAGLKSHPPPRPGPTANHGKGRRGTRWGARFWLG